MNIKKFIVVVFLILSIKSYSQSWSPMSANNSIEKSYYIKKHNNSVGNTKVWVKLISNRIPYIDNNGVKKYTSGSELTLYNIDCNNSKIEIIKSILYDSSKKVIKTTEYNNWIDVAPETISEAILIKGCEIL